MWTDDERAAQLACVRKYQRALRDRVLEFLGGKCVVCGFDDHRALQIDHVNGGGSSAKYQFKQRADMYRSILNGKCKDALQILCANHNWIKRHEKQEWGKVPGRAKGPMKHG